MPIKTSIATKIFGLALVLLCLLIVVAAYLLVHVTHLSDQLDVIADRELPLSQSISDINDFGLRRRIAFERWFGALDDKRYNPDVIEEAKKNYELYTNRLHEEFIRADALLEAAPAGDPYAGDRAAIATRLQQVEDTYPDMTAWQSQLIQLQEAGESVRVAERLDALNDTQRRLQDNRTKLKNQVAELVQHMATDAQNRERQILWLTAIVTLIAVLVGLLLSYFVTRGLVRPVRSLVEGMQSVEKGDLQVEVPISSSDEVGALTKSFNYFVSELRAKQHLKSTFGKYIDPRILERVILQPSQAEATGGRREVSVSFSDIVGFTPLGEQLTPAGLVNLLNSHFGLQSEVIQKHLGVVDKFIGDAVMAFWGAPLTEGSAHALLACRAAMDQLEALEVFRAKLPDLTGLRKNLPAIDIRIGIGTGEAVVGTVGSENTRSYTVIGDTVNFASRLESANRTYGTRILMNEKTVTVAGPDIASREIDFLLVKGKSEPQRVFELLGMRSQIAPAMTSLAETFQSGLGAYRACDWDAAERALQECTRIVPGDPPSVLFLKRVRHFRQNPPPPEWDGVWHLESK